MGIIGVGWKKVKEIQVSDLYKSIQDSNRFREIIAPLFKD